MTKEQLDNTLRELLENIMIQETIDEESKRAVKEIIEDKIKFKSEWSDKLDIRDETLGELLDNNENYMFSAGKKGERLNLDYAYVPGINLSGAYVAYAVLDGAYLKGAICCRADLTEANLREADLDRAVLLGANLNEVDLRWSYLKGVKIKRSQINTMIIEEDL